MAACWARAGSQVDPDELYFDAEWRADPGYPNYSDGFPVELSCSPYSDPCVVDINGDGDLEIVYSDYCHRICVYDHDGTPHPGWPVSPGTVLSRGPVAVGDLNGDGQVSIVVGTDDGRVLSFDPQGNLESGFPAQTSTGQPVYVSIGILGGFYPRTIVAAGGDLIEFLNYRGVTPEGADTWYLPGQTITHPAAIGDVNGDGINEAVFAGESHIRVVGLNATQILWGRHTGAYTISDALTLGDLDLDGDVEVVVPTEQGVLIVLDDDGNDYPNFPVQAETTDPMTSVALANIWGLGEPELVFASHGGQVEVFYHTGDASPYYPPNGDSNGVFRGGAIVGDIDGFPSDVIVGGDDRNMRSWNNTGESIPGWPRETGSNFHYSPAMGDLDQDGFSEVVFLGNTTLHVVSVGTPPQPGIWSWPMFGYDPERTGCHNCGGDYLTPVDPHQDEDAVLSRVRFSSPAPNPTSGPTLFSFDIPVQARVTLDIFDIRGHRVSRVFREEVPPGAHTINWNGRDPQGQNLASGVYFAKLKVSGPGLDRELSRKINLLR